MQKHRQCCKTKPGCVLILIFSKWTLLAIKRSAFILKGTQSACYANIGYALSITKNRRFKTRRARGAMQASRIVSIFNKTASIMQSEVLEALRWIWEPLLPNILIVLQPPASHLRWRSPWSHFVQHKTVHNLIWRSTWCNGWQLGRTNIAIRTANLFIKKRMIL